MSLKIWAGRVNTDCSGIQPMVGIGDIFISARRLSLMLMAALALLSGAGQAHGDTRRQVQSSCCPPVEDTRAPRANCALIDVKSEAAPKQFVVADNARKFIVQCQGFLLEELACRLEFVEIAQTNNQKTHTCENGYWTYSDGQAFA